MVCLRFVSVIIVICNFFECLERSCVSFFFVFLFISVRHRSELGLFFGC